MTMTTWPEIMDALADQIQNALGSADPTLEAQVYARRQFSITPPAIDMYPTDPAMEEQAFGGEEWDLYVTVRARVNGDHDDQQTWLLLLADPISTISVRAAVSSDSTLGSKVSDLVVGPASGQRLYEDVAGQGAYLGCEWPIRVIR